MRLRAATSDDIPAIAALHAEGWRAFASFLPAEMIAARGVERRLREWPGALRTRHVVVAEEDGEIAGFVSAFVRGDGAGELSTFFVGEGRRGRGVGGALLAEARAWLAARGAAPVEVRTFAEGRACALFERLGGKVVSRAGREVTYRLPEE